MKQVDFSELRCKVKVMLFHIVVHQGFFTKTSRIDCVPRHMKRAYMLVARSLNETIFCKRTEILFEFTGK